MQSCRTTSRGGEEILIREGKKRSFDERSALIDFGVSIFDQGLQAFGMTISNRQLENGESVLVANIGIGALFEKLLDFLKHVDVVR